MSVNEVVFPAFAVALVTAVEVAEYIGAIWRAGNPSENPHVTWALAARSIPIRVAPSDFFADFLQVFTNDRVSHAFSAHAIARPIPSVTAIVGGSVKSIEERSIVGNGESDVSDGFVSAGTEPPAIAADSESDGESPAAAAICAA